MIFQVRYFHATGCAAPADVVFEALENSALLSLPGFVDNIAPYQPGVRQPMQLTLLKCKLHRACVTHAELDYEGSCAMDVALMERAGILPFEQIQIYNLTNGERFTTYAIEAERDSRIISINGAAAHKASPGDRIIICAYAGLSEQEAASFKPSLVYLNEENRIIGTNDQIAVQVA